MEDVTHSLSKYEVRVFLKHFYQDSVMHYGIHVLLVIGTIYQKSGCNQFLYVILTQTFCTSCMFFPKCKKEKSKNTSKKKKQTLPHYFVLFNMHDSTYSFMIQYIIYLFMDMSICRLFRTSRHMLQEAFTITACSLLHNVHALMRYSLILRR